MRRESYIEKGRVTSKWLGNVKPKDVDESWMSSGARLGKPSLECQFGVKGRGGEEGS